MRSFISAFFAALLFIGCQGNLKNSGQQVHSMEPSGSRKHYSQVTLKEIRYSNRIGIKSYTLITDDFDSQRKDAEAIMQLKWNLPLAMQTKDRKLFDNILGEKFIFRAENEFYTREDYIRNRVERPQSIESANYENLVLQFFGETAVLTYRNIVKVKNETGDPEIWRMSWADVFRKETLHWKIAGIHLIEAHVKK